jgi:hypothetical protein
MVMVCDVRRIQKSCWLDGQAVSDDVRADSQDVVDDPVANDLEDKSYIPCAGALVTS